MPIEYDEVSITRRIYRSGETGFFINKASCRLKDIQELFMDTGIGKDGYSIIGQGKIDEIMSNKSDERRHVFEEAAGIVKYRTRKVESEKKLESTKENLIRINDIILEIESNIQPLKIQSEKARKYLDLREELKKIEVGLFVHNINEYKDKISQLDNDVEIFNNQKLDIQNKISEIQLKREKTKNDVQCLNDEIERIQNLGFEISNKKEKINSDISLLKEKSTNNTEINEKYSNEITYFKQRKIELENDKERKLNRKNDILNNKTRYEQELQENEAKLQALKQKFSRKELEIEEKKKLLELNIEKKYELVNSNNLQVNNYENIDKQIKSVKDNIQKIIYQLDSTRTNKEDIINEFYDMQKQKIQYDKDIAKYEDEKNAKLVELNQYETEIINTKSDIRIKTEKCKFLIDSEREKEGYSKVVKKLTDELENNNELKKGVHGILLDLISVEDKYCCAIETVLGYTLQNIVTETEEEAKKLINYLKINKLGRASFLPINSIKPQTKLNINFVGIDGYIGVASELVKCKDIYKNIVSNILGHTVIVDTIDTAVLLAKKNKYSFRIVTLDGDIINSSGMMSGGSTSSKTVSILGRENEILKLKKQLQKLNEKVYSLVEKKENIENELDELKNKLDELQVEYKEFEIQYITKKQKCDNIDLEIEDLDEKLKKSRVSIDELEEEKLKIKDEQNLLEDEINKIVVENDSINRIIEEFTANNKNEQKIIDDLNFAVTNLKISVSSFDEGEISINEIIERIDKEIENNDELIKQKENLIITNNEENVQIETNIKELEQLIIDSEEEVKNSNSKIEDLKNHRVNQNNLLTEIETDLQSQQEIMDNIKNSISRIELKKSKYDIEKEQIINKMWEEYELTPNNIDNFEMIDDTASVTKQVDDYRRQIKDLGNIDVDSIERYKELKQRYDFLSEQRYDLEESIDKLRNVISDITGKMKKQFKEKLTQIDKNFSIVFKELFGGGNASIELTDENNVLESGIEINVQPPGKKLQNMMLLSGGERAFSAIALLFAILKINPSPFCVLDEIEAALDDVNVYRFAEYLKKFCKSTQFLVITHRKGTMEAADTVYGITMEEKGISKLLSIKL